MGSVYFKVFAMEAAENSFFGAKSLCLKALAKAKGASFAAVWALIAAAPLSAESEDSENCRKALSERASSHAGAADEFAKAMTEGMLLHRGQDDLFEFYINNWFGRFSEGSDFDSLQDMLDAYPGISKLPARERRISFPVYLRNPPESLRKFLQSFRKSAAEVRNNMFHFSSNWGFWARMLSFPDPDLKGGGKKRKDVKRDFMDYAAGLMGEENFGFLTSDRMTGDYRERTKTLYKILDTAKKGLEAQRRSTRLLSKTMALLVHATGFGNDFYMDLLKSADPLENIHGIKQILLERGQTAFELGFEGHFDGLKAALGAGDLEDWHLRLNAVQEDIEREAWTESKEAETFRVRPLSLLESPYRSCLSGDCASHTYFKKALDPDFLFFTLTDSAHRSSGYIAVVLGSAQTSGGAAKTAFVDKIQNIPTEKLIPVLEAVRQSLAEHGFRLGLPKDTGNENGLSNERWIRNYVRSRILPLLEGNDLTGFQPRGRRYDFSHGYSRANTKPDMLELKGPLSEQKHFSIQRGGVFAPKDAPQHLSLKEMYQPILRLKDSPNIKDQIKYASQTPHISKAAPRLLPPDVVTDYLQSLMEDPKRPFNLRKSAFFSFIEIQFLWKTEDIGLPLIKQLDRRLNRFSPEERKILIGEMSNWKHTRSPYRRDFMDGLNDIFFAAEEDLESAIESAWNYTDLRILLDIDYINQAGETPLMAAAQDFFDESDNKMKILLERGAHPDIQDAAGQTVFMHLIHPEIYLGGLQEDRRLLEQWLKGGADKEWVEERIKRKRELLLQYGADIENIQDAAGETGLMKLARSEDIEDYEFARLLERVSYFDAQDNNGETALMKAADWGKVQELAAAGADIDIKDHRGQTVMDKIAGWERPSIPDTEAIRDILMRKFIARHRQEMY